VNATGGLEIEKIRIVDGGLYDVEEAERVGLSRRKTRRSTRTPTIATVTIGENSRLVVCFRPVDPSGGGVLRVEACQERNTNKNRVLLPVSFLDSLNPDFVITLRETDQGKGERETVK